MEARGLGDENPGNITLEHKLITSFSWTFLNFRDATRLLKLDPDTLTFQSKELEIDGTKGYLQLGITKRIMGSPPQITHLELQVSYKTNKSFWKFAPPLFNGPTVLELSLGKDRKEYPTEIHCKTSWTPASCWMTRICATSIPNCYCNPRSECTCGPFIISCKIFGISEQPSVTEAVPEPEVRPCEKREEIDPVLENLKQEAERAFANVNKGSPGSPPKLSFLCECESVDMCLGGLREFTKFKDTEVDKAAAVRVLKLYNVADVQYFCQFLKTGMFPNEEAVDKQETLLDLSCDMECHLLTRYLLHAMTPRESTVFKMMFAASKYPDFKHVTEKCLRYLKKDARCATLQSPCWDDFIEKDPKSAVKLLEIIIRLNTPSTTKPKNESQEPESRTEKTMFSFTKFWAEHHTTVKLYLGFFISFAVCLLSWWAWHTMGTGQDDVPVILDKPRKPEKWGKKQFYGGNYHHRRR